MVSLLPGSAFSQLHLPRVVPAHVGNKSSAQVASRFNGSDEAVRAYLDWLAIVTRDEINLLWPQVEKVAHALVRERTLTAAEVKVIPRLAA